MRILTVLVSAALLAFCGVVSSQPQPPQTPPAPAPGLPPVQAFPAPGYGPPRRSELPPPPVYTVLTPPAPPAEKSVDDLLNELERVQAMKAQLAKQEQELKAAITKKLEKQDERLLKLGVVPKDTKQPDRVGRIILEGNMAKDEKKIRDALGMLPGQVLQYPALEEARVKLEKAGFKSPTVEVVPSESGVTFKDIRVRVAEPEPKPVLPK